MPNADRPRLIPVLDVMNGRVVRAVGGRRAEYRPVESTLTASAELPAVAEAMIAACGTPELYIADLDAIIDSGPCSAVVADYITRREAPTWVDAGIGGGKDIDILPPGRHIRPVVGLETAGDPRTLARAVSMAAAPVGFSIDLKGGALLGNWEAWGAEHPQDAVAVARTAVQTGARALIVLDLARVGTGAGTGTEDLLRAIRNEFPGIDLLAGGGVRTWDDVDRLGAAGATGVLVASALHDGTLKVPRL